MVNKIYLNDLLNLENLSNIKIRFNKNNGEFEPIKLFKENKEKLFIWQFWNYNNKKSYKEWNIAIWLARIEWDKWLLFDISKITKDLNKYNDVWYEYKTLWQFEKYFGRVIIHYHNIWQNLIRLGSLISELEINEILPEEFNDDNFPWYENINLSWEDMSRVVRKKDWKTALENQKWVYLITDITTGKFYVGSAYWENMILGRWESYIRNGHWSNVELKKLVEDKWFDYIKTNFRYSILDIYKARTDDKIIINRESRWKEVLLSRKFGYNSN